MVNLDQDVEKLGKLKLDWLLITAKQVERRKHFKMMEQTYSCTYWPSFA
jgi:hypothetical protein